MFIWRFSKMPKVVSHLPDGERVTHLEKGTNLLDGLLQNEVPMSYHCKKGVCGKCRTAIIVGNENLSHYTINERNLLESEEIQRGKARLACEVTVNGDIEIQQYAPRSVSTTLEDW